MKENMNLEKWLQGSKITENEKNIIRNVIEIYSDYISSTNPNYLYNTTYLPSLIDDFFTFNTMMQKKYKILKDTILKEIEEKGIDKKNILIKIDEAWIFKNEIICLEKNFDLRKTNSSKMKLEIEHCGDNGFVVAEEIELAEECKKEILKCIDMYLKLMEVQKNEKK